MNSNMFLISLYSTRVSNELGAGHPEFARLKVYVALVMAIIEGTLGGLVLILIRNIWGYAYSNEIEVVKYVASLMPILAVSNFLDGIQCVLSGFPHFQVSSTTTDIIIIQSLKALIIRKQTNYHIALVDYVF